MLEFCSIGHDQICYETVYCPACQLKDEMQKKIDDLQEEMDEQKTKKIAEAIMEWLKENTWELEFDDESCALEEIKQIIYSRSAGKFC